MIYKVLSYSSNYIRGHKKGASKLAYEVKQNNPEAISKAANLMSTLIPKGTCPVLIPIPNHDGYANYTLTLAKLISKKCKGVCLDILEGEKRDTFYSNKNDKNKINFWVKKGTIIPAEYYFRPIFLVDNVLDTGLTFFNSVKAIRKFLPVNPKLLVLVKTTNSDKNVQQIKTTLFDTEEMYPID